VLPESEQNCRFPKSVVVFSNSATKVKNGEQLIDCFTANGAARGAARPCLPNQTA